MIQYQLGVNFVISQEASEMKMETVGHLGSLVLNDLGNALVKAVKFDLGIYRLLQENDGVWPEGFYSAVVLNSVLLTFISRQVELCGDMGYFITTLWVVLLALVGGFWWFIITMVIRGYIGIEPRR